MNLNFSLEEPLAKEITRYAKSMKKQPNTLIREAVKEWILHHEVKTWPKSIVEFKGIKGVRSFQSHRRELSSPKKDPFA